MGRVYNWVCAGIAGSGSMLYGYDAAVIASTFAQEGFIDYFQPSAKVQGAIGSSYYGGVILGLLVASLLANHFGRKRAIQIGGCIGLIGAILQAAAHNIATFFAGRVIAGAASGVMLMTVNIYQSEIAPPSQRGAMVAFQILTLTVAGTFASWVGYACNFSSNLSFSCQLLTSSRRFPIALQCLPAVGLILGCFYLPFSPRWLIMKGRHEEARIVLQRLHDDHNDHMFWEKEYLQISAQLAAEAEETADHLWTHIFTNMRELRRVAAAVAAMTSTQTNGAQTIQIYQSVLYAGLGFSHRTTLLMAGIFGLCNNAGGVVNLLLIDRAGRKFLFLSGLSILSICLAVFAAFSAKYEQTNDPGWGKAGIGIIMVFIFFFGSTFAASPYAYAAEVLPTKIRATGMSIALFSSNAVTVIFSQTAPIALQNITWKFNLVFIGCNLFFLPIVFFFFPETKGLTLEEVNRAFGDKVEMEMFEITDDEAKNAIAFEHRDESI
ncbi:hypothetical protein OIDMADRAFT_35829 [Oidiodendron maius Zn]|uniref:Major facilitator superfamily (MFS) profile domain-containing protein n=1 Tax=Oidiodendron maius (strain Zn) TaxID=913774 RepID=A0A0C3GAX6_OIDMZ|nr:hypothetical protein OIDMADRAFT_35829 [Oidiodendron maius Zn]